MTVPGKGGRPRKWLSDADRVRAHRARLRGEPEPPTVVRAATGDDALAAALQRQRKLEELLVEARARVSSLQRDLTATEVAVHRLEGDITQLERDRVDLLQQVADLNDRLRRRAEDTFEIARRPSAPAHNRAARRRASRKRHS